MTYLFSVHEDLEFVRGRARWQSVRTAESYLQEVGAWQFVNTLEPNVAIRVQRLSSYAPFVLDRFLSLAKAGMHMDMIAEQLRTIQI